MNHAFRSKSGREDRLIERARMLGRRLGLDAEFQRWRDLAPYGWIVLSLFVFLLAYGTAVAVIGGERSINAVLAFLVALGMHGVTLTIWCIAAVVGRTSRPGAFGRISLGSLLLRLVAWMPAGRGPHSLTMLSAASALLQRARLIPWAFGFVSHTIWAIAFMFLLIALWFAFSFREYKLTWETTILSADFFIGFVQATGWLPHKLGFPVPDALTLLNPGAPGSDQRAWAWWLIACVFVYGLLPRVALAGLGWILWQRGTRSLKLDTADPYFRKLLARFEEMDVSTVVDSERRPDPAISAGHRDAPPGHHQALAIIGFELPAEYPWPPGNLGDGANVAERISGTSQERRAVLNTLAQARPYKILVTCNPASSPDRGTERFIREACAFGTQCGLLLAPLAAGSAENSRRWQTWLHDTGMNEIQSFTDLDSAAAWFMPAHG